MIYMCVALQFPFCSIVFGFRWAAADVGR